MTPEEKANVKKSKNSVEKNEMPVINESGKPDEGKVITKKKETKNKLVFKCNGVSKKVATRTVVKNCNMLINKGEVLAVIAPEGHGKSTFAKLAAGLISPTKGQVLIRGERAGRNTNDIVSYQPDIPFFKYDTTVSELLNLYSRFFDDFSYKKAYELLRKFDISRGTRFENLSTTALFIVQVIMIASRRVSLYIFDDPLIHCDPKYRNEIIKIIDMCRKHGAVLLLSQIASGLDDITDKVVFFKHGAIEKQFYDANTFEEEYGNSLLNDVYKEVFKHD